jgi:hypothetical protein
VGATEHMDVDLVYVADSGKRPSEEGYFRELGKVMIDAF